MHRVLIDVERTKNMNCGLGQYCWHLAQSLLAQNPPDLEIDFLLPKSPPASLPVKHTSLVASRWRQESLQRLLRPWIRSSQRQGKLHLWHATHQDTKYMPLDPAVPLVLTVHDLNFLHTNKRTSAIRSRLKKLQAKIDRAAILTTGSRHAAGEIREYLHVGTKRIEVIPHGICLDPQEAAAQRPAYTPPGKFLFAIGEVMEKKNFHTLVDMLELLPGYNLVIAGAQKSHYATQLVAGVRRRGLSDRVVMPGCISNPDRAWLYRNCEAFLLPSLAEGFGLPMIEAMMCGRPVFSSSAASLPEVGGDLAFYWKSFEPGHMADVFRSGMQRALADEQFSARLRRYTERFSWSSAAQRYLDVYAEVLGRSAGKRAA